MTKQQQFDLSEIMADGSEIRSLAGRSARLGDGTSRNTKDRDIRLEQRSKDLAGMIGQVRGFDLDQFLSDWEPQGEALPWAIRDDSWNQSKTAVVPGTATLETAEEELVVATQLSHGSSHVPVAGAGRTFKLSAIMSGEGVSLVLSVLRVWDYISLP